ncbi:MAG: hypothetical protein M3141_07345, partial [Actinomycetota bacterium]|nr:hypothetical protein [Actinomycetota bacterium]
MVAVTATALTPAPVGGHAMTSAQVRSAAQSAAATLKRQTRASSTSVRSCRRSGPHLSRCAIGLSYARGASRCTVEIEVRNRLRRRGRAPDIPTRGPARLSLGLGISPERGKWGLLSYV